MTNLIKRMLIVTGGLFVFSIGVFMIINADLGVAPWDCLSLGIASHIPYSYGKVHTVISILIVVIDVLLKEKIGIGTILDALLVGNFVDLIGVFVKIPTQKPLVVSLLLIFGGMIVMAVGQYFYMGQSMSCGPRDTLLVAIGKRLRKLPIGLVEVMIQVMVLTIGFVLGGPVGIGTVLSVFGIGTAIQLVFNLLKFEPRNITHESVIDSIKNI